MRLFELVLRCGQFDSRDFPYLISQGNHILGSETLVKNNDSYVSIGLRSCRDGGTSFSCHDSQRLHPLGPAIILIRLT